MDIPFAVSPVVAGLVYLLFYAPTARSAAGWMNIICKLCSLARNGAGHDLRDVSVCGARAVPVMLSQGSQEDEAAILLGALAGRCFAASHCRTFAGRCFMRGADQRPRDWRVWRSVGGFRSIRGETLSLPLQIELLEQDTTPSAPLPLRRC